MRTRRYRGGEVEIETCHFPRRASGSDKYANPKLANYATGRILRVDLAGPRNLSGAKSANWPVNQWAHGENEPRNIRRGRYLRGTRLATSPRLAKNVDIAKTWISVPTNDAGRLARWRAISNYRRCESLRVVFRLHGSVLIGERYAYPIPREDRPTRAILNR